MNQIAKLRPIQRNLVDELTALSEQLADQAAYDDYARFVRCTFAFKPFRAPLFPLDGSPVTTEKLTSIRDRAQALIDRRVVFPTVVAALAFAEAKLGNKAAAEWLVDYDRFFLVRDSVVPADFVGDFFSELAEEVRTKLKFLGAAKPGKQAIHKAWRHDNVLDLDLPACRALKRELRRRIDRFIADLPADDSHPLIKSRPADYTINSWAVVSSGEGHLRPHIHPRAWMSGVFYIVRPQVSIDSSDHRGWFKSSPPDGLSPSSGWDERFVAPEPGRLLLMPGYFYHSTEPSGADQERMCIAFDVCSISHVSRDELKVQMEQLSARFASKDSMERIEFCLQHLLR